MSRARRWCRVAALVLVAAFVASRVALLVTSYDANRNWEEPVFLFSALELQRDGIGRIFAYQDDLNHGGSVVLLLLAVPWISWNGTSLLALKGVAILWSALTLCALMGVAWRYFSARVALLLGLFDVALSPTLARLNITLVGSHPEAVLPCMLALGCYLEAAHVPVLTKGASINACGPSIRPPRRCGLLGVSGQKSYKSKAVRSPRVGPAFPGGVSRGCFGENRQSPKEGDEGRLCTAARFGTASSWVFAALGLTSGLALWVAYVSAMFVVPLLALQLVSVRSRRAWMALGAGLLLGVTPWVYQDVWLHPHGATMWLRHVGTSGGAGQARAGWSALTELAQSFGYAAPGGGILLGLCGAALALLWIALFPAQWRSRLAGPPRAVLPLLIAPLLGIGLLAVAVLPLYPNEGYYHSRFFVPLQVSLFWVLALALDFAAAWMGRMAAAGAALVALLVGCWAQAPLFMQGNHYQPDARRDRLAGCTVFGVAERDRSGDVISGIERLAALPDEPCREQAFGGFGWTIASRYIEDRNLDAAQGALNAIADTRLRWAACGGFNFLLSHTPDERMAPAERSAALQRMAAYCRTFRP
jgi:hypothetical protein